jgi:ubiquinone/menaquinone biosynthesis C-methylase UbiE
MTNFIDSRRGQWYMDEESASIGDHYDELADRWNEFIDVPWRNQVLWPTIRSLLPEVAGKDVLDVGCGDGTYSTWLADRGAEVVGIDVSQEMVRTARETYGDHAEFRQADITNSLSFAEDQDFDLVLCQHVFSHLEDLNDPLAEFARVLKPGGVVVVSTHHPFHDFLVVADQTYPDTSAIDGTNLNPVVQPESDEPIYHETERFGIAWGGPESSNPGTYYRRSLSGLLQPLLDAGFELQRIIEPDLCDLFEGEFLEIPQELLHRPSRSICFRARRI